MVIKIKKVKSDIKALIEKLKDILKQDKDIVFAFTLGSYAKEKPGPLSDFDIGIYLKEDINIFEKKLALNSLITDILNTDEVDIVILNNTSPFFVYNCLKNAKLLFSKDERKRISFIVKNIKEYFDMQYYYQRFQESFLKRIEEGKYGM